jgi:hypothetical protein
VLLRHLQLGVWKTLQQSRFGQCVFDRLVFSISSLAVFGGLKRNILHKSGRKIGDYYYLIVIGYTLNKIRSLLRRVFYTPFKNV